MTAGTRVAVADESASAPRRRWVFGASGLAASLLAVLALLAVAQWPEAEAAPSAASADAGFARDMAVHHQQAVELSFLVRDGTDDEEVRRLAYDVINTQANQRGMLLGLLDSWGLPATSGEAPMAWMGHEPYEPRDGSLMPGMATDTRVEQLRQAEGRAAEVLYLQLLTAHHRAGVDMAEGAVELADDQQIRNLAKGMARGQRSEMKLMAGMLADRDAPP
ncbi:DUF305 domain-containing protein [Streptomyces sp. MAR4 CNX-425]|uniref:DUF305 domain-containing protein n=1 Tax=Streptomyces sp. MAR4 CNX-425 TaxID=3406343 RepID=UPI003B504D5C